MIRTAPDHPTEDLITCCGDMMPIDVEMVPICRALWSAGIHTQWCCQGGNKEPATIGFPDIAEADKFAEYVFGHGVAPVDASYWGWSLVPYFPLAERADVNVTIPHAQVAELVKAFTNGVDYQPGQYIWLPGSALPDPRRPTQARTKRRTWKVRMVDTDRRAS